MSAKDQIHSIISSVFPNEAEIRIHPDLDSYKAGVNWNLNDDPERPNKKSKTIVLEVTQELIEDLPQLSPSQQDAALRKIERHLKEKLKSFDPSNDAPYGSPVPAVTWRINLTVAGLTN